MSLQHGHVAIDISSEHHKLLCYVGFPSTIGSYKLPEEGGGGIEIQTKKLCTALKLILL